jgi:hypothetical protein
VTLIGTVLILEHINTFLFCCKILGLDINVPLLQKNVEKIKMSHFFSLLKDFASADALNEFKFFNPKNCSWKYNPGSSSKIRILDQGFKKAPDPGSGYATL